MRRLALLSMLALAAACGKSAPDAPDAPPAAVDAAPAVDTVKPPPPSPLTESAAALSAPLDKPEAVALALDAVEKLTAWADANPDHPDAAPARLAAARGGLLAAVAGAPEERSARLAKVRAQADALVAAGTKSDAVDPARVAAAAAAIGALDPATAADGAAIASAFAVAAGDDEAAAAARTVWLDAAQTAIAGLRAAPGAEPTEPFAGGVARLLCGGCAEAAKLAPTAVSGFLLEADHGAGLVCDSAKAGAASATTNGARAALLAACDGIAPKDAEPSAVAGENALIVALLGRAAALAALPDGEGPLAPLLAARREALTATLAAPYPLPVPAVIDTLPEGDRSPEDRTPAAIAGLPPGGVVLGDRALGVFVIGPDAVRGTLRPTVAIADGALVSRSAAATPPGDGLVFTFDALAEAEVAPETGGIEPIVTAGQAIATASDAIAPPDEAFRPVELVVDALAPTSAVVRTLDSLRAAGFSAFRFTRGATAGDALPFIVRAAPEVIPAEVAPGFAQPIIVNLRGDGVDVWAPADPADPAPSGDARAALPEGADTGYRGKKLVRLRVATGDADARGLTADTVAKVLDAVAYWRKASGNGALIHVAADDDAEAADVLRIADAFQRTAGAALADLGALWPGATCPPPPTGGPPSVCPAGVAVAFSAITVPSSRGITPKPAEREPPKLAEPPPSPEFCNSRDIKAVMAREKHAFRFCYETELRTNPTLEGKVPVVFTIALDGSVKDVKLGAVTLPNDRVKSCIVRAVSKLRFAKPDGGRCLVRWPFLFQPK
ncbi:MAG: hypothetical protein CVU56_07370 [Deltaproteobacteria bacterium HGW-Deltaproteobacteria-14]|nr:MAG: hypothetical protein CVU56_07370 [Deltaproteobacteria bacterium HGW-Deltaproteobacteria-14]